MNNQPKPATLQQLQTSRERAVFDALFAISFAIDNGIVAGVLVTREPRQFDADGNELTGAIIGDAAHCELIFPKRDTDPEDAPNPSKVINGVTPMSAIEKAGRVLMEIIPDHPNGGANYTELAKGVIAMRGKIIQSATLLNPGKN